MSNIVLGALLENLFEGNSPTEEARRTADASAALTRGLLWVVAIVGYGMGIGFLQTDAAWARAGLVLAGVSIPFALAFVLYLAPEWVRSIVLHRARKR